MEENYVIMNLMRGIDEHHKPEEFLLVDSTNTKHIYIGGKILHINMKYLLFIGIKHIVFLKKKGFHRNICVKYACGMIKISYHKITYNNISHMKNNKINSIINFINQLNGDIYIYSESHKYMLRFIIACYLAKFKNNCPELLWKKYMDNCLINNDNFNEDNDIIRIMFDNFCKSLSI